MAEIKESSVLFSLNQLMSLEQQRLREENEAAARKARIERETRLALELRAREEEAARLHAERERRRSEEAREREEAARLEAIRQAAVETARIEAEQRARLEAMETQQRHERELARMAQDAQKRRLQRFVTLSSVVGVLLLGTTFGVYFGKIQPEAERAQAEQTAARIAQEERLAQLKGDLDARNRQVSELTLAVQAAQGEAERAELLRRLTDVRRERDAVQGKVSNGTPAPQTPKPEKCVCRDGDPMCGCLP
jgi:colicin import membrane protein